MDNNLKEQEVSTKEFLAETAKLLRSIGKSWRLLMIGLLSGAIVSFVMDIVNEKETNYIATVSFNLDISGGSSGQNMNQMSGFATAFGIGGFRQSQSGDLLSGANFPTLAKSRIVFEKALMTNVVVEGDTMLMANYYKDSSDIENTEWAGSLFKKPKENFIDYRFVKKSPDEFTPDENEIVTSLYTYLYDKTNFEGVNSSSLTQLSVIGTNDILAKVWVETLLKTTEVFYKEVKTQKTRNMLVEQQSRLDSLRNLMNGTDSQLANLAFRNPNIINSNAQMKQQQVGRNNSFYSTQYYTQLANVESLNRLLTEQTPIFTIIDPIRLPLMVYSGGLGQSYKLGSILGLVISLVIAIVLNTYREIVGEEK
jgi:hypothetical protein